MSTSKSASNVGSGDEFVVGLKSKWDEVPMWMAAKHQFVNSVNTENAFLSFD